MDVDGLILVAGALLAAGVAASLLAERVRLPVLLLFLAFGMVLGSDVSGLVAFDDYELARDVGIGALALILFDGGLRAGWPEIRPVVGLSISLATVGTATTAALTGLVAAWLFDLSTLEGLLLGAVLCSTDGAAVFALLRGSTLRRRLARALEGESGFNDPVAVLLVIGFIEWLERPGYGLGDLLVLLGEELLIGAVVGLLAGRLAVLAIGRLRLASPGLYPVATLAAAALAFGAAGVVGGSGFLAVYLAGLALGTAPIPARRTVGAFHDGLAWLAQIGLFVTLGLLVFPSQLGDVWLEGTILALVLAFVSRPLGAAVAAVPFGLDARETALLGWAGLRGAVPVVLATFVVAAEVPEAVDTFNIVFFAVLVSTALQGTTVEWLARRLGLTTREPALPPVLTESGTVRRLGAEVVEYHVGTEDAIAGRRIRDLGLPRDAVVNVVVRGDQALPPRGSTRLYAGDELHVLVRREAGDELQAIVQRWRSGPVGDQARPRPAPPGRAPVFSAWAWRPSDGDASRPAAVRGRPVVDVLRRRRDRPGALVLLDDGRYAVTGPRAAIGSRGDVTEWARRRLRRADEDDRAWLQTVVGALAADDRPG